MEVLYPASVGDIPGWARTAKVSITEARTRFVQLVILKAVASSRELKESLVLKGGNALDFVWQPNRSTKDLDFSVDSAVQRDQIDERTLGVLFTGVLTITGRQMGVELVVHRVKQNPPGPDRTFITYEVSIGYAFSDQRRLLLIMREGVPSAQVIRLDISMNEVICASELRNIDGDSSIRVSSFEDIIAEKLRALLQQPVRKRSRKQDLLDIAVAVTQNPTIDKQALASFLLRKAEARNVPVSREAFHQASVREYALQDYAELRATTRERFVEFDEAMAILLVFVDTLDIPPA